MPEINKDLIANLAIEISNRYKTIMNEFPDSNDDILRHLACSALHMAMFMNNFASIIVDRKCAVGLDPIEKFLEECGCKKYFDKYIK